MTKRDIEKAEAILLKWKQRRPIETSKYDVLRLLDLLEFKYDEPGGSHVRALHPMLYGFPREYGPPGSEGVSFVLKHPRIHVGKYDLLQTIVPAAELVISRMKDTLSEESDDEGNHQDMA